ncbi:hypothetical protein OAB85_06530, partial [Pseudomonadales bacterium]|nr:hypothetical protein [Pseudomonadales bacterium]
MQKLIGLMGLSIVLSLLASCGGEEDKAVSAEIQTMDFAANANKWVKDEFQPSTLSPAQAQSEMAWFTQAAQPFRGMSINVVSETLTTHEYESATLAQAFFEITGIRVNHDLIQEGDVIEKLQTQMQSGENVYDAYINDS